MKDLIAGRAAHMGKKTRGPQTSETSAGLKPVLRSHQKGI